MSKSPEAIVREFINRINAHDNDAIFALKTTVSPQPFRLTFAPLVPIIAG
jgi:hypothetical protein